MATVKYYKMFIKFTCTLFNLPIDHLHKLISYLSIEFIRMELRMHCVCILMYCDIFASGLLFTETTTMVWIKLIWCSQSNHWKTWLKVASYCFLKCAQNANICILKSFSWIFQKIKTHEKGEGLLRTRISSYHWCTTSLYNDVIIILLPFSWTQKFTYIPI